MAVEARHLNLFPPQILSNRELVMNGVESNGNVFGAPMGYGVVAPSSAMAAATETAVPMYGSAVAGGNLPVKTAAMKCESGLTYAPVSRKRSREAINSLLTVNNNNNHNNRCGSFTFLGEDVSFQIQQQQLEVDRLIAQHTEKVRMEIEERRKRYARRIAAVVEENMMKKLKARDEEIDKIGKLNYALEERVKSLCVENQIWRDLAQTNEATANALRSNLEQVLAQVQDEQQQQQRHRGDAASLLDDANSCCGSNYEETGRRGLADQSISTDGSDYIGDGCIAPRNRMCRSCGREESCVLLLPCRHLCLCTICGSTLHTCPVCNATKTASVHVNLTC
ncbi:probable boi-related E3 ubiquitin-protein ligase 3 [Phtheirospermum japonicum]|uniref:Probable boi-related E3 ubiquitin-protein ligase 3 n=1 Tax=Phtheirospermum japonicum TaxID=374723 RepID=A0A830CKU0_9LAMI|nr:probable boi-related E3 ubiquitin-protein ligase 3 [Phtheirospermum japonicum]